MKRLFAAALAVSFILYLAACGGGAAASSPKDAVATMLDAMKNADTAKMKTVMTKAFLETDQAQKEPTEEERNQMKEMFKAYTWEVGEETIAEDGNTAQVMVKMSFAGMENEILYQCVKEDGTWKVDLEKTGMGSSSIEQ